MKIFDIVKKDLTSSFRSLFLLVFMFGIPLLVTGMFYIMFGGNPSEQEMTIQPVRVQLVNLDTGDVNLEKSLSEQLSTKSKSLGELIETTLFSEETRQYFVIENGSDYASAKNAVESGEVDLAVYFPPDLSANFVTPGGQTTIETYYKPENAGKAQTIQTTLAQIVDGLSISRIAVDTGLVYTANYQNKSETIQLVAQDFNNSPLNNPDSLVTVSSIEVPQQTNFMLNMLAPIMGGMMIFFAFFTGTTSAQTILREAEQGTLSRLFTTPTSKRTILAGKLLAVLLTVLIQVSVLIIASHYLFKINWGTPFHVLITILAIVVPAAAFGIFANTLVKNTKQSGAIFGGLLTVTGMIGMMDIFTGGTQPSDLTSVSLFVPQGWSMRTLSLSMTGETTSTLLIPVGIALIWSVVFILIGIPRFAKRFN